MSSDPLLILSAKADMFRYENIDGKGMRADRRLLSSRSAGKNRARESASCGSTEINVSNSRTMGRRMTSIKANLRNEVNMGGTSA